MLYVSLMIPAKQKPIVDTQEIKRKESTSKENHEVTKEESIRREKEEKNFKTTRKQYGNKPITINYYFSKYKLLNSPVKR